MAISTIERLAEVAVEELTRQGYQANWYRLVDGTIQVVWVEGSTPRWAKLREGSRE